MDTDIAWELWGQQDPYYGVLTHPRFRTGALTQESRQVFFASGQLHVDHVLGMCRRHFDAGFAPRRVLDFGCGVGRTLLPFAAVANEVVGVDVAPSMLAEARRNALEHRLNNLTLVLSDDSLASIEGRFDLVHTSIVLQHIAAVRGRRLFARLLSKLEPGGFGVLHVTYAFDAHADTYGQPVPPPAPPPPTPTQRLRATLRTLLESAGLRQRPVSIVEPPPGVDPEMQMHCYALNDLMFMLQRDGGASRVVSEFTDHGGALGVILYFRSAAGTTEAG